MLRFLTVLATYSLIVIATQTAHSTTAHAQAELKANCARVPEAAPTEVICDLRSTEPRELSSVTVATADGKTIQSRYEPFNYKLRSSAWLFMIQRTSHPRDGGREVERLIKIEGKRSYGAYAFGEQLDELSRMGSSEADVKKALAGIGNRTTTKTSLYTTVRDGITKLAQVTADRRALVLVADGRSDRDAYQERDVVELARQYNVVLLVLALTDKDDRNASQNLQALRRLAEQTGGALFDAGSERKLSPDTVSRFHDYLESGGQIRMAIADVPQAGELKITASLVNGPTIVADKVVVGSGPQIPTPKDLPLLEKVTEWIQTNLLMATAGGLVAVGALGLLLIFGRRSPPPPIVAEQTTPDAKDLEARTARPGSSGSAETLIINKSRRAPEQVYGWLQFLDASSTRVPIGATSVRIGRHEDNDICLPNKSVHRQHAVIHLGADRTFVVRDLGGQNGVVVNDKRVEQRQLADGDIIEFGEVRARFVVNRETVH